MKQQFISNTTMTEDQDPILLARKFERFFYDNYTCVKRFALLLLKSEEDAEDITQEIFVNLWQHPEFWLEKKSLNGYLFVVTKNAVFNFLKHQNIEQHHVDSYARQLLVKNYFQQEEEVLDRIYYNELQLIFRFALDQMPEKRKQIFMMSRFQGLHHKEIAERLQISVRTVEQQVYLALSGLKKVMYAYCVLFLFYML